MLAYNGDAYTASKCAGSCVRMRGGGDFMYSSDPCKECCTPDLIAGWLDEGEIHHADYITL